MEKLTLKILHTRMSDWETTRSRHERSIIVTNLEAFNQNTLYYSWNTWWVSPKCVRVLWNTFLQGLPEHLDQLMQVLSCYPSLWLFTRKKSSRAYVYERENEKERKRRTINESATANCRTNVFWRARTTLSCRIGRMFHIYMHMYVCVCVVQGVVKHAWRQQAFGTGSRLLSSYYPNL